MTARLIIGAMLVLLMITAVLVIYAKHQNRMLYTRLNDLQQQRDELNVDWGRLQLELSTWATHGRVESVARKQLGMRTLDYGEVVVVKP